MLLSKEKVMLRVVNFSFSPYSPLPAYLISSVVLLKQHKCFNLGSFKTRWKQVYRRSIKSSLRILSTSQNEEIIKIKLFIN